MKIVLDFSKLQDQILWNHIADKIEEHSNTLFEIVWSKFKVGRKGFYNVTSKQRKMVRSIKLSVTISPPINNNYIINIILIKIRIYVRIKGLMKFLKFYKEFFPYRYSSLSMKYIIKSLFSSSI